MANLLKEIIPDKPQYRDRRFPGTQEAWDSCLKESSTVYVGNLSFCTREEQIYEVFAKAGRIERVIMGLHKELRTPCGFCFVVYHRRADAETAVSFVNRTMLDNRVIRVDIDWGFVEGRQYGRGKSGGQVRDEYRQEYDPGRGGLGVQAQYEQGMKHDQGPDRGRKRGRDFDEGPPPGGPVPPPAPPPSAPPPPPAPPPEPFGDDAEPMNEDRGDVEVTMEDEDHKGDADFGQVDQGTTNGEGRSQKRARLDDDHGMQGQESTRALPGDEAAHEEEMDVKEEDGGDVKLDGAGEGGHAVESHEIVLDEDEGGDGDLF